MSAAAPARYLLSRRVHPAWIVAAAGFVTLLMAAGFRATPGVLLVPLQDEFGWSRATISGAVSVNLVLYGLAGPFAAALTQRYGIRVVVPCALGLIAAGSALTVAMTSAWQLYLFWGVMVGLGAGCVAPVLAATIANRWFQRRRGLVVGLLTAGASTGQLIFLPVLAALTGHASPAHESPAMRQMLKAMPGMHMSVAGDGGHWRVAALVVAAAAVVVAPLAVWLLRERPSDLGVAPYGAGDADAQPVVAPRERPIATAFAVLREARADRRFVVLAVAFFICGATTNGLIATHFVPAAMDHDIPETMAASMLAAMGLLDVVGTTASGWLTDRFDPRKLLFMYYGLRGLSLLALPHALGAEHLSLGAFVAFYGLDWIATVPPTVALAVEAFGPERGTVVYGWVFAAHQLGAATAAEGAGAIRDAAGTYTPAFLAAGALSVLAAVIVLFAQRRSDTPEWLPEPIAARN
jgi:sugar phosphate permease